MNRLNYFKNRPKARPIDVNAYLKRLGLDRESPTLDFLKKLHSAHVHRIPFENLDIHYNRKIILDYQKIFDKVIVNKRGGFCYELNGLLYHLLYHLGYDCYCTSASFQKDDGTFSPEYDHMIVIVFFEEGDFLVDVGFGEAFIYPKKIETGVVQVDFTTYWRFDQDPDENHLLKYSFDASNYTTKYRFDLKERHIIQFLEMCDYHQTSPESMFTNKKLITIKTKDGRITLTDKKIKITALGAVSEYPILNEDEFLSKLEQYFSIKRAQLLPYY